MAQAGDQQAPRVLSSDFLGDGAAPTTDLILLILNYHLPHRTIRLWTRAKVHVCADGGANRLYDLIPQCFSQDEPDAARSRFVPDVIKGDLDSIRPEVAEFYRSRGAKVVDLSGDQDSTDLMKCLKLDELGLGRERLQASTILALGGLGGRLDHTLCNLNTLCLNPDLDLVLLGDTSIARLVPAGYSCIRPDATVEGPTCGLIPLEAPTTATSTGLKWNLDNHIMKFGGLVSSSNVLVDSEVTVQCDQPLIWTTEFRDA